MLCHRSLSGKAIPAILGIFSVVVFLSGNVDDSKTGAAAIEDAIRCRKYDAAIALLNRTIESSPQNGGLRKQLASVYLKTGDTDAAVVQLGEAMKLLPQDYAVALEYGNLCIETNNRGEARRVFDRIRKIEDGESKGSAEQAFQDLDQTLSKEIKRWLQALEKTPDDYSIHYEIANLSEQRSDLNTAAEHYLKAWFLSSGESSLLLDIARVRTELGQIKQAKAALAAALASDDPRVSERARELMTSPSSTVDDLKEAMKLWPDNDELRRQLDSAVAGKIFRAKPKTAATSDGGLESWAHIFSSLNLDITEQTFFKFIYIDEQSRANQKDWQKAVQTGSFLILQGQSRTAAEFGFVPGERHVFIQNIQDFQDQSLPIIWEKPVEIPVYKLPPKAKIFAWERWTKAPLVAGYSSGRGAVLWTAVSPGQEGYERFPYLLSYLGELGFSPPFVSRRLWAFFDASYRVHVDLDYFARLWRTMGISALHVGAWNYYEVNAEADDFLRKLILACHRNGILVYAWLELPHVSLDFWAAHPQWREKTALLQDAQVDWRYLMNLMNADCFRAVSQGVRGMLRRFNWDGLNLAELYFESLLGIRSPAHFTPMNQNIRGEFLRVHGFDPVKLFDPASPLHYQKNPEGLRAFLDFRAEAVLKLQEEWVKEIEGFRSDLPNLDMVLTHVDDRFDTRMRDLIGADAAALLQWLKTHDLTFLIEDPGTIWHLGPQRYPEIARRYVPLTRHQEKLAIDINVVERTGDRVYPTLKQTGTELFQLIHLASKSFARVAFYAEHTLLRNDWALLPSASAVVNQAERRGETLTISSPCGVGVRWPGGARVDRKPWPFWDSRYVWLPPGVHTITPVKFTAQTRLIDFNGSILAGSMLKGGLEFRYQSSARALAVLNRKPARLTIDGVPARMDILVADDGYMVMLPKGEHRAKFDDQPDFSPSQVRKAPQGNFRSNKDSSAPISRNVPVSGWSNRLVSHKAEMAADRIQCSCLRIFAILLLAFPSP